MSVIKFILTIYFQHHARKRAHVESGDNATYDERANDCTFVIEWTTRFLYFLVLMHDDKKLKQTAGWKKKFYNTEHEDIVHYLNDRHVTVFAVTFMLHCILTHLHVFSQKNGTLEPEVKMFTSLSFDGKKALKEESLWLLSLGQDSNESHYSERNSSTGTGAIWVYNGSCATDVFTPVPGIGISQLDPRNQEVLCFAHSVLYEQLSNKKLAHASDLTFPGGSYGSKPKNFLCSPLFLGGWPKAKSNAWTEDEGKEDSREIREV